MPKRLSKYQTHCIHHQSNVYLDKVLLPFPFLFLMVDPVHFLVLICGQPKSIYFCQFATTKVSKREYGELEQDKGEREKMNYSFAIHPKAFIQMGSVVANTM